VDPETGPAMRWYMAVAYAASEVGGLMAFLWIISLLPGVRGLGILVDVAGVVGLGAWLWWRKSRVAATLVIALVSYEYAYLWLNSSGTTIWAWIYPVLFLAAVAAHGRKPKTPKPERMMGLRVWAVIVGIVGVSGVLNSLYAIAVERDFSGIIICVVGVWIWAPLAIQAIRRQALSPRWFWFIVGTVGGPLVLIPIWHHGREWKSTSRKVIGWLLFLVVIAYLFREGLEGR